MKYKAWLTLALFVAFAAQAEKATEHAADARASILLTEQQRCDAISSGDVLALGRLLAEDYVHVHGTAKIDDKAGFIDNVKQHPRRTERGELTVRLYGDIAVMTGKQFNYALGPDGKSTMKTENVVSQVLHRAPGGWQFVSFQLTPLNPPQ
jgi:ketosteroid isomerase-like protein